MIFHLLLVRNNIGTANIYILDKLEVGICAHIVLPIEVYVLLQYKMYMNELINVIHS